MYTESLTWLNHGSWLSSAKCRPFNVVPEISTYRYVKSKDTIESSPRPASQVKTLYSELVACFALRTLAVLAAANDGDTVETIVLSCFVNTIDPATGREIRPCLLTVRVAPKEFGEITLKSVEPMACLRHLKAQLSPSPH